MKVSNLKPVHHNAVLQNVGQFIQLTSQEEMFFTSLLREKTFKKNEAVLHIGEICRHQTFVVKGCIKVYYSDEQGVEHIVKFAIENWWAFDIESFFNQTPCFYAITCIEDAQVLQLSKEAYEKLIAEVPAFERFYRIMMQNSFIALQHRMTQSLALAADERYLRFQQKYPGLESRISQRQVAAYLGITPVFLSMLRKKDLVKH